MSKHRSFLQNRTSLILMGLFLSFLVSACWNSTPLSTEFILTEVETAVVATINALATASAQEVSTATSTPTPSPTVIPTSTPTQVVASPTNTAQIWYWSYYYYTCADSEYIKDMNIPDGTVLAPGETFTKTWKFKNTGDCKWTSDFSITFVDGDDMDGSDTEIDQTVNVNKKAEISIELTAPDDEGTYVGYWQLADEYGNTFGDTVYVEIVVEEEIAPGKATLLSPTGSITTNVPTYTWQEVSAASYYLLQLNGPSGNVFQTWYTAAQANCNGITCSVKPAITLSSGAYNWWVQTWNSGGYGPVSDGANFTVSPTETPTSTSVPSSTPTTIPDTPSATSTSVPISTPNTIPDTPVVTSTPVPTSTPTPIPDTPVVTSTPVPISTPTTIPNTPVTTSTGIVTPSDKE